MSILRTICEDNNIKIVPISDEIAETLGLSAERRNGAAFVCRQNGISSILFDPSINKWTNGLNIAHELAHILYGHASAGISKEVKEQEAQIFGAVFIALALWDEYSKHSQEATA